MKRVRLLLSLSLLFASVWCAPIHADDSPPAAVAPSAPVLPMQRVNEYPNALLSALKQNDFAALMLTLRNERTQEATGIAALASEWDRNAKQARAEKAERSAELGSSDKVLETSPDNSFELAWQKLQTEAGVDQLVVELQPELAERAGKSILEFNIGFGAMLVSIAGDKDFNAEQVQQLTQLMYAVQDWTGRVDFADPERLRRALRAVSRLVRQTGIKRLDELNTMAFEDAIVHGDTLLRVVKQVLAAYDVDADEILNSVRLSEVDAVGDRATLRAEGRVFGVLLAHDFEQQYFEGAWVDAEAAARMTQSHASEAEAVAEAAPAAAMHEAQASPRKVTPAAENCGPERECSAAAIEPETSE